MSVNHDGTIYVEETKDERLYDHLELYHTHTGLVYSKEVVSQVLHFFEEHKFNK